MPKPDLLIFISDQHNAGYSGFAGNTVIRTPNLDKISANGTVFDNCYTTCPLCTPARISFMTGQLISRCGAFDNRASIANDKATFMHSIAAEGYETVLCGRMHFRGLNQRHGFTKRIFGDILPAEIGREEDFRNELGPYKGTFQAAHCLEVVGGGDSPVLAYDRAVINAALDYLKEEHEKPQCIVIGTYGPHFTYVAPPELYTFYKDKVTLPETIRKETNYSDCPTYAKRKRTVSDEEILKARAAYFGMITTIDSQVGAIKGAWDDYLQRHNREGVFVYTSDHGDNAGEHYSFGKQNFFEDSARIPLLFEGFGVKTGQRIKGSVSITDILHTFCDMIHAVVPPELDGRSLLEQISGRTDDIERHVISEYIEKDSEGRVIPGRMLKKGKWKLIKYYLYDEYNLLFDLEKDPNECENVYAENPEIVSELEALMHTDWNIHNIQEIYKVKEENYKLFRRYAQSTESADTERWVTTEDSKILPKIN